MALRDTDTRQSRGSIAQNLIQHGVCSKYTPHMWKKGVCLNCFEPKSLHGTEVQDAGGGLYQRITSLRRQQSITSLRSARSRVNRQELEKILSAPRLVPPVLMEDAPRHRRSKSADPRRSRASSRASRQNSGVPSEEESRPVRQNTFMVKLESVLQQELRREISRRLSQDFVEHEDMPDADAEDEEVDIGSDDEKTSGAPPQPERKASSALSKEGYVELRTDASFIGKWTRRYLVLRPHELQVFEDSRKLKHKDPHKYYCVPLEDVMHVELHNKRSKGRRFEVALHSDVENDASVASRPHAHAPAPRKRKVKKSRGDKGGQHYRALSASDAQEWAFAISSAVLAVQGRATEIDASQSALHRQDIHRRRLSLTERSKSAPGGHKPTSLLALGHSSDNLSSDTYDAVELVVSDPSMAVRDDTFVPEARKYAPLSVSGRLLRSQSMKDRTIPLRGPGVVDVLHKIPPASQILSLLQILFLETVHRERVGTRSASAFQHVVLPVLRKDSNIVQFLLETALFRTRDRHLVLIGEKDQLVVSGGSARASQADEYKAEEHKQHYLGAPATPVKRLTTLTTQSPAGAYGLSHGSDVLLLRALMFKWMTSSSCAAGLLDILHRETELDDTAFSEALVLRTMFLIQHLRINVACATADDDEVYTYGSLGCHTCQDHTHAFLAEFTEWSVLTRERKYVEEYQLRAEDHLTFNEPVRSRGVSKDDLGVLYRNVQSPKRSKSKRRKGKRKGRGKGKTPPAANASRALSSALEPAGRARAQRLKKRGGSAKKAKKKKKKKAQPATPRKNGSVVSTASGRELSRIGGREVSRVGQASGVLSEMYFANPKLRRALGAVTDSQDELTAEEATCAVCDEVSILYTSELYLVCFGPRLTRSVFDGLMYMLITPMHKWYAKVFNLSTFGKVVSTPSLWRTVLISLWNSPLEQRGDALELVTSLLVHSVPNQNTLAAQAQWVDWVVPLLHSISANPAHRHPLEVKVYQYAMYLLMAMTGRCCFTRPALEFESILVNVVRQLQVGWPKSSHSQYLIHGWLRAVLSDLCNNKQQIPVGDLDRRSAVWSNILLLLNAVKMYVLATPSEDMYHSFHRTFSSTTSGSATVRFGDNVAYGVHRGFGGVCVDADLIPKARELISVAIGKEDDFSSHHRTKAQEDYVSHLKTEAAFFADTEELLTIINACGKLITNDMMRETVGQFMVCAPKQRSKLLKAWIKDKSLGPRYEAHMRKVEQQRREEQEALLKTKIRSQQRRAKTRNKSRRRSSSSRRAKTPTTRRSRKWHM